MQVELLPHTVLIMYRLSKLHGIMSGWQAGYHIVALSRVIAENQYGYHSMI